MRPWFVNTDYKDLKIKIKRYNTIPSTQVLARTYAQKLKTTLINPNQWLLITAEEQTAGIGQYSRSWLSPPKHNIYVTYIIPFPKQHKNLSLYIPQTITIAIAEALEGYGFKPKIKWINDLLINNKKIGGILCEHQNCNIDPTYDLLLFGIGLNVNMPQHTIYTDQPISSLLIVSQKTWDKAQLLYSIQEHIFYKLSQLIKNDFCSFYNALNQRLAFLNEIIHFEHNFKVYKGILNGITQNGALALQIEGRQNIFFSGRILQKTSPEHQKIYIN